MQLLLAHPLDNIYTLTIQYNEVGAKYPPRQLKWNLLDYLVDIHSAFGGTNHIWHS
jgi:hypothetical protein